MVAYPGDIWLWNKRSGFLFDFLLKKSEINVLSSCQRWVIRRYSRVHLKLLSCRTPRSHLTRHQQRSVCSTQTKMGPKATKEPNVTFPTTASAMCCFVILSAANSMTERQQATKMAKGPVSMCFFTHAKKNIRDGGCTVLSTVRTLFTRFTRFTLSNCVTLLKH